jgi:SAM-dependent methyltransferase
MKRHEEKPHEEKPHVEKRFEEWIAEAESAPFAGWDFSWARGRWHEEEPPWDYPAIIRAEMAKVHSMLDMGTGGGEFLAGLAPLPPVAMATESYPPNLPVAQARLEPLGVQVIAYDDDAELPLPGSHFDLVINRHDSYWPSELYRILRPGGYFITQQVGPRDNVALNVALDAAVKPSAAAWALKDRAAWLATAGLEVVRQEECYLPSIFNDIGVVLFYLRIIEWQIPDFTVEGYLPQLMALYRRIEAEGPFHSQAHRYLLVARKPH